MLANGVVPIISQLRYNNHYQFKIIESTWFNIIFVINFDSQHYFQIAVVSALKGLQEKIRKLELERADAEDNLKKLATESRHYKDVLQKELHVRDSTQGVVAKQNKGRL